MTPYENWDDFKNQNTSRRLQNCHSESKRWTPVIRAYAMLIQQKLAEENSIEDIEEMQQMLSKIIESGENFTVLIHKLTMN